MNDPNSVPSAEEQVPSGEVDAGSLEALRQEANERANLKIEALKQNPDQQTPEERNSLEQELNDIIESAKRRTEEFSAQNPNASNLEKKDSVYQTQINTGIADRIEAIAKDADEATRFSLMRTYLYRLEDLSYSLEYSRYGLEGAREKKEEYSKQAEAKIEQLTNNELAPEEKEALDTELDQMLSKSEARTLKWSNGHGSGATSQQEEDVFKGDLNNQVVKLVEQLYHHAYSYTKEDLKQKLLEALYQRRESQNNTATERLAEREAKKDGELIKERLEAKEELEAEEKVRIEKMKQEAEASYSEQFPTSGSPVDASKKEGWIKKLFKRK